MRVRLGGREEAHRGADERVGGEVDVEAREARERGGHPARGVQRLDVDEERRGEVDLRARLSSGA